MKTGSKRCRVCIGSLSKLFTIALIHRNHRKSSSGSRRSFSSRGKRSCSSGRRFFFRRKRIFFFQKKRILFFQEKKIPFFWKKHHSAPFQFEIRAGLCWSAKKLCRSVLVQSTPFPNPCRVKCAGPKEMLNNPFRAGPGKVCQPGQNGWFWMSE